MESADNVATTIQHAPLRPPRKGVTGEAVFSARWTALMHATHPDLTYDEEVSGAPMLSRICSPMWYPIGQREATVAATFACWLGTNMGLAMLRSGRANRRSGLDCPTLLAWTLHNRRHGAINGGARSIDLLLAPDELLRKDSVSSGACHPLESLPDLSLRDAEVIEHICIWLDTRAGQDFITSAELEIERQQDLQSSIARAKNDPMRRRAEEAADGLRRQGTDCHVRRWYGGYRGWFVVRNEDYRLLVEVGVPED